LGQPDAFSFVRGDTGGGGFIPVLSTVLNEPVLLDGLNGQRGFLKV